MAGTTTTGRKPREKKPTPPATPSPEPDESDPAFDLETEPDAEPDDDISQATGERDYATGDDIDDEIQDEDVLLPVLRKWVNVRVLENPELARLENMPQYSDVSGLIQQLGVERTDDQEAEVSSGALAQENAKYLAAVAHVAVRKPGATEPEMCGECSYAHIPSLWRFSQTRRLHQVDVAVISDVALAAGYFRALRPFSKVATLSDTSTPATSSK